ncbi:sensor of ECF-type sigma factor [Flavobacterium sp. A45]|uniref:sensor of ECF-type sigma factor n=1 Tax=Flavobacterium sp. A45 TaxID=1945862 RepID=UPI00098669E7|nr:sensor of ECF-type sigma factor [Flavobacterium sp. A45]OOG74197.1 sensor of ECF-type sigma factor [Flavobacterium sp. A45]
MDLKKLLPILFLFLSFNFYAQNENFKDKKEQIRTMKVAFFTTELDLTSSEAEKFWPLYNTFDDKQFELRHQKMKSYFKRMQGDNLDKLSEKDATALLDQIQDNEDDLYNLRKKFILNLKEILPPIKILKLKKAEENFNRKLLQQYRDKGSKK